MPDRRELYHSVNGDTWFLGREPQNGHAFIIHQPNAPSGGRLSHIEVGDFLREGQGPEQQALLRLIGTRGSPIRRPEKWPVIASRLGVPLFLPFDVAAIEGKHAISRRRSTKVG
jgi:hypothetical protein